MRTRKEIEKTIGFIDDEGGHDFGKAGKYAVANNNLLLEALLDIRDLLATSNLDNKWRDVEKKLNRPNTN